MRPVVIVPKKTRRVRIFIDTRTNETIQREKHPTPTIDDLITDLNSSKSVSWTCGMLTINSI